MKKLLITAVAIGLAAISQGASAQWKTTNQNPSDFASMHVYAVSASDYAAAITDLTTNDGAKFIDDYSIASSGKDLNARGGATGAVEMKGSDTSFALFIFKDGIVDGKTYYTTGLIDATGYTYSGTDPVPGTLELGTAANAFSTTGTIAGSSPTPPTPIPEPTSGLLFVLGIAGLALRRKRA